MNQRLSVLAIGAGVFVLCTACGSTTPKAAEVVVPTRAQVTAGMLALSDLPSGYTQSPSNNSSVTGGGPNASCDDLAKIVFSNTLQGAAFEVDREFDGTGQSTITESVAPYTTTAAATAMVQRFGTDASNCQSLSGTSSGTTITFKVSIATKPTAGSLGFAVTLTGTGAATGVDATGTFVLDGATVLGVLAPTPAQANDLTTLAVNKFDHAITRSTT